MRASPTEPPAGVLALLGTRRFLPLFLVQFLGAFNDQLYQKAFLALVTYRLAERSGLDVSFLGLIASAVFILPFALIPPWAGQVADRIDKALMTRLVKAWEVVLALLAALAYHAENLALLYGVLFLFGVQSAVFAPVKYALLPQYLPRPELLAGNGMVQGATFVAILLGTILGTELILAPGGVTLVSALVLAVAVAGLVASLFAPPAPPAARRPFDWHPARAFAALVKLLAGRRRILRVVLSISWFWFLGAAFLALLPAYARDVLGADQSVLTVLLVAFSVGIALGALLCHRLARGRIGLALPAAGALGIALIAVELWFATPAAALIDRAAFLAMPAGWRLTLDFALLALFAGLYVTPLNALLQVLAPPGRRARFIAAAHVVDSLAMIASAAVGALLVALGLAPDAVLVLLSLTGLATGLLIARHAPATPLGRLALWLWPPGPG